MSTGMDSIAIEMPLPTGTLLVILVERLLETAQVLANVGRRRLLVQGGVIPPELVVSAIADLEQGLA